MWILESIVAGIGTKVVEYLKDRGALIQFEKMQAEILEGWMFKIQIAIREEHQRHNVPHKVHKAVIERINAVVDKEFDTGKL